MLPHSETYCTPESFAEQEGLDPPAFLAILAGGLRLLPEIVDVAGELRILKRKWQRPDIARLASYPGDEDGRAFIPADHFCETFGLGIADLLRLAVRYELPPLYSSKRSPGTAVLDPAYVRLLALRRQAEVGRN